MRFSDPGIAVSEQMLKSPEHDDTIYCDFNTSEANMFNHHDITRNSFMLHGPLAHHGYDWWWHSFTAQDAQTGEDKPFFIEFFICNPALA